MAVNAADFYSASQQQRADATQRAAEVRKKLLKGSSQVDAASDPDEAFMIGQWTDSQHSQAQSEDQYHASASGKDPALG